MASRRKVKPGRLELSPDLATLEVHYESLELAVLPSGQEAVQATKQGVKRIRLALPADGDLQQAAQRIVEGCKLLHPSRTPEVAEVLAHAAELQQRRLMQPEAAASPEPFEQRQCVSEADRQALRAHQQQYLAAAAASATQALAAAAASASLDRLEEYLEALYEEDPAAKAAAAAAVAQLCRQPAALAALLEHPTLVQALARLLREDARRSEELAVCLLAVFSSLSRLPAAHPLLVQGQVGSLTMELLDLELRRAEHWQQSEGVALAEVGAKLLRGEPLAPAERRLAGGLARQEPALYLGLSLLLGMAEEDPGVEQKMVKKGLLRLLCAVLDRGAPRLLALALAFLQRLSLYAENSRALGDSEVVAQLAALVPASGAAGELEGGGELLPAALRLLFNLSFDEGMRAQMVAAGLIAKAAALLRAGADGGGGGGAADSCGGGSQGGTARPLVRLALGLLYHLSLQDKHRSMFLYTDAIPMLHAMLLAAPPPLGASSPELAALLVSLASSSRVAEELSRGGRLEQLLALVAGPAEPDLPPESPPAAAAAAGAEAGTGAAPGGPAGPASDSPAGGPGAGDELLWRLLHCMAEHDSEPLRARFAPALERIARLLMAGTLPPFAFVEALGCLAALDIPGHSPAALLASTGLPAFLAQLVRQAAGGGSGGGGGRAGPPLAAEQREAVLLQVAHMLGVLCADAECAEMLAAGGLVDLLHELMMGHMEDEPCVLATTAAAARLLAQPPTRAALLAHPEVAARFAELLQHPCQEARRAADAALDAVAAGSEEWAGSVRRLKFEAHNREWLQLVQAEAEAAGEALITSGGAEGAAVLPHGQAGGEAIGAYWGSSQLAAA